VGTIWFFKLCVYVFNNFPGLKFCGNHYSQIDGSCKTAIIFLISSMSCFQRDTELGKRYKRTEFEKRDTNAKGNIHL